MVAAHSGIHGLELPHFPHVWPVHASVHERAAVAAHVVAGHGGGAGVGAHAAEFLHCIENDLVLEVLHFLNIGCVVFVLMAHHFFHWSGRAIGPPEGIINVPNVHRVHFELSLDGVFTGAFDSNFFAKLPAHLVLVNASCNA